METVVRNWVVYEMTESAIALGLVNSTRAIPSLLLSMVGGVLADRVDRRVLLMISQAANGCCGLILGVLIVSGIIEPWHFAAMAFVEGAMGSVQQPARQALVPSLVPPHLLLNAITWNGSIWRVARTGAPPLAAGMAALAGPASALFLEAALYAIGAFAVSRIRRVPVQALSATLRSEVASRQWDGGGRRPGMAGWIDAFKGYGYLRQNPIVGGLVLLALIPILFGFAQMALAPIFAKEILGLGIGGVGLLLAAPGVGSIVATGLLASAGDLRHKGLISIIGIAVMGIAASVYGLSSVLWLSLGALALHGFAQAAYQTLNQTLVQLNTPDEYRGRVMAVYHMDRSLMPISTLTITALADFWGPQLAVAASGVGCLLMVLIVGTRARSLRRLD